MSKREIKFRVWDIPMSRWGGFETFVGHSYAPINSDETFIVEQFTGFLDRNGKEICEGDIVRREQHGFTSIYEVVFEEYDDLDYYGHRIVGFYLRNPIEKDYFEWQFIEIIGNIHENPELLTQPSSSNS